MEQLTNEIVKLFEGFENLDLVIENNIAKLENPDELNFRLYIEVQQIKLAIKKFYLIGNVDILSRTKNELLRIDELLKVVDFGIMITNEPLGEKYLIEPETVNEINKIKRTYLTKLLKEVDSYIPRNKTEIETGKLKLKVNQIALIHVYEGIQITRENAGEIAAMHGYTSKNSGEGLFQDYTNYCSTANRKAKPTPCTPKRLKNKIELFESVINYLTDSNKQRAIDEIQILKTIFDNEYQ